MCVCDCVWVCLYQHLRYDTTGTQAPKGKGKGQMEKWSKKKESKAESKTKAVTAIWPKFLLGARQICRLHESSRLRQCVCVLGVCVGVCVFECVACVAFTFNMCCQQQQQQQQQAGGVCLWATPPFQLSHTPCKCYNKRRLMCIVVVVVGEGKGGDAVCLWSVRCAPGVTT